MAHSTVESLLAAVRRRMWRSEFVAAARLALWATAALMLFAAAVHLAARPIGVGAVLAAVVVVWTSMAVRAGLRRPSESACALWADRHLGGASSFSTWIEVRDGALPATHAPARTWLEHWVTARVPDSLRLLDARPDAARLSRPLLSMLVCAAFALVVLTLPGLAPPPRPAAPGPSAIPEPPAPKAESVASTELVGELAQALRSAESQRASDHRQVGPEPAAQAGKSDKGGESAMVWTESGTRGERATTGNTPESRADDRALATGATGPASTAGGGRAAGDSADNRADAGSSQAPRSTMPLATRAPSARRPTPSMQADMEQAATFGEDSPIQRTAKETVHVPAAAPPPAAADSAQLTPTQSAYLQAWMKATGRRR